LSNKFLPQINADKPLVDLNPNLPFTKVYPSMFKYADGDGLEENDER
jgi:hypothetical protein